MAYDARVAGIAKAIRDLQIQGAINVARAALSSLRLYLISGGSELERHARLLAAQRPTEPALKNCLAAVLRADDPAGKCDRLLSQIGEDADRIVRAGIPLIKEGCTVITHCHASSVTAILREARARGRRFRVMHTETRPRFQGHRTARELAAARINPTMFVDSATNFFMPEADLAMVGADALMPDSFANKIGTSLLALSARENGKPLYVVAGLLKFAERGSVKIERRPVAELGFHSPGVHLENPAFDFTQARLAKAVVCEEGILGYREAVKRARRKLASL